MTAHRLDITTPDGVADVHLFVPDRGGADRWPAALFFPDAGGVRDTMRAMAQRLSDLGYAVLLPNIYYRAGAYRPFDVATVFGDPAERARLGGLMNSFTAAQLMADVTRFLDAAGQRPDVDAARVRCVGYCMGGRHAFIAASALGERVIAAASIHGGNLATDKPDSAHRGAPNIRARLYFGVADQDPSFPPEQEATLRQALDAAGVHYALEHYPGAAHGFAVPDFPVFDAVSAERHWQRVEALFAR